MHCEKRSPRAGPAGLDAQDITQLLQGSQLGSRFQRQVQIDTEDEEEANVDDADDSTEDPDYIANDLDYNINYDSNYSDASTDLEDKLADLITDQNKQTEMTFLQDLLKSLRELNRGRINWADIYVDDLVNTCLRNPLECMKMVVDELNLIETYTGVKIFNVSDLKPVKINKIVTSLQTSTQVLLVTSKRKNKVKTLQQVSRAALMNPTYPKVYLQIVIANSLFNLAVMNWPNDRPVTMEINVDAVDEGDYFEHICHSAPEFSVCRQQHEFRCINPGHTLANMRSQMSRYGYEFCSNAAFVRASITNHKVLPKSILEDRLNRKVFELQNVSFPLTYKRSCTRMVMTVKLILFA